MKLNSIGLDEQKSAATIMQLNELLANHQQFYMNLRGFHWNIKGRNFFELHLKFEELYTSINLKIDEIAERILALEGTPLTSFTDYQALSTIKEVKDVSDGIFMVKNSVESFGVLVKLERTILADASQNSDEGTMALMSGYVVAEEKLIWMLNSYLNEQRS
jgi:starvation-inducible DNA-binding protein